MLCPGCGAELAKGEKTCKQCGYKITARRPTGLTPGRVKLLMIAMVIVLIGSAAYAVFAGFSGGEEERDFFDPAGRTWVPLDFEFAGIKFEVPGEGWHLALDASSRLVFRNDLDGELDLYFVSIYINPELHRVDNKPHIYDIIDQKTVRPEGLYSEATVTTVEIEQEGIAFCKQQLFFRRSFVAKNSQQQTFTYLVTLTYPKNAEGYKDIFQHILDTMSLYEYN